MKNIFMSRRQTLGAAQHDIWAHWMKFMFSCGSENDNGDWVMPQEKFERWTRQMDTKFKDLTVEEQESDCKVVDEFSLEDI